MAKPSSGKTAIYLLLSVLSVFVAGRFLAADLFGNNWSFTHFKYLSESYVVLWLIIFVAAVVLFAFQPERITRLFDSRRNLAVAAVVLYGLFVLFQFDSFLYGGGNLRIA